MIKTIQTREEAYLQFTEDEMAELGLKQGQKFTWVSQNDGSFLLKPHEKIEIELSEYPREILEFLIKESIEKDISVNDIINEAVEEFVASENY
jgi:antitoxin component of MazEF toxin-antitoxin module